MPEPEPPSCVIRELIVHTTIDCPVLLTRATDATVAHPLTGAQRQLAGVPRTTGLVDRKESRHRACRRQWPALDPPST
jgi:hypothetical protein